MDSYNKEAIFHLPGLFMQTAVNTSFISLVTRHPEYLKDNVKIGSVYGCPTCTWNGGRGILKCHLDKVSLEQTRDFYISQDIPARFTFTNSALKSEHKYDAYGNLLLKIFNTGKNEIVCNNQELEDYIREQYGDRYKYISSTTKRLNNIDEQNKELEKDYYLVVLDYDYNNNFEYLKSIPNKDKCEILINSCCVPNCPLRKEHYLSISRGQIELDGSIITHCPYGREELTFYETMDSPIFIKQEDINTYIDMGFSNFKIEGRLMLPLDVIEIYLYYLVKKEYQPIVRAKMHTMTW